MEPKTLLLLIISLLLTALAYLIFPALYVFFKGKVPEKKGKKLALINSIAWELIFTIAGASLNLEPTTTGSMFAQGFFYYFIAKRILIDYEKEQDNNKNDLPLNVDKKNCLNKKNKLH